MTPNCSIAFDRAGNLVFGGANGSNPCVFIHQPDGKLITTFNSPRNSSGLSVFRDRAGICVGVNGCVHVFGRFDCLADNLTADRERALPVKQIKRSSPNVNETAPAETKRQLEKRMRQDRALGVGKSLTPMEREIEKLKHDDQMLWGNNVNINTDNNVNVSPARVVGFLRDSDCDVLAKHSSGAEHVVVLLLNVSC